MVIVYVKVIVASKTKSHLSVPIGITFAACIVGFALFRSRANARLRHNCTLDYYQGVSSGGLHVIVTVGSSSFISLPVFLLAVNASLIR